jgi:hypothetical protein
MRVITRVALLSIVLALAHTGCTESPNRSPLAPVPPVQPPGAPPSATFLVPFTDIASGFSTTDVHDVQEQVIQFNSAGELIWTQDGSRIPGYPFAAGNTVSAGPICQHCVLEVRFGTRDGERRAYLTLDRGHDNTGMVVDIEVAGGGVILTETNVPPPGTYTLSGFVFETTPDGRRPIAGATVSRSYGTGWQNATTDEHGMYSIRGLYTSNDVVAAGKQGYQTKETMLAIEGDTRFDIELVRTVVGSR